MTVAESVGSFGYFGTDVILEPNVTYEPLNFTVQDTTEINATITST